MKWHLPIAMTPFEHVPYPVSEVVQKVAVGADDTPHERATGMHARRGKAASHNVHRRLAWKLRFR